jgi:hypothetical protein
VGDEQFVTLEKKTYFWHHVGHKCLSAEAWFNRHDQHLVIGTRVNQHANAVVLHDAPCPLCLLSTMAALLTNWFSVSMQHFWQECTSSFRMHTLHTSFIVPALHALLSNGIAELERSFTRRCFDVERVHISASFSEIINLGQLR